jgi:glycosyltransferase involved in cell wall biosynthesis
MRIGIDARMITSATTGAGRVIECLLEQLPEDPDTQFVVFHAPGWKVPTNAASNVRYVRLDISPSSVQNFLRAGAAINAESPDVLYYPFVDVPFFLDAPVVAVVYDLFHMYDRQYFADTSLFRFWVVKALTWWRLRVAAKTMLAISQTTADQIRRLPGMKHKNVQVVALALTRSISARRDRALPPGISPQTFFLYVGNNRRHKNLPRLIAAFEQALPRLSADSKLVMCGTIDSRYEDPRQLIRERQLEHRVVHLGHVDDELLDALYRDCIAAVVPSIYEGFGLPALEAASRGKTVLCSNASALREVLGGAAVFRDAHDVEGWSEAMADIATNPPLRDLIGRACEERAAHFSPERFARETLAALINTARGS